jgi:predicted dehydrogenase
LTTGLIGVGSHGIRYARHILQDVPELALEGIFQRDDRARHERARELGVTPFGGLDHLLDACRVVIVVTPPASHVEIVSRAIEAGAWVLVEKPVVRSAPEAAPLLALDSAAGGRVMVAQTLRYDAVVRRARGLIDSIRPVRYLRMAQRLNPTSLEWQRDAAIAGGGSILLTGVHLFDAARWLLGGEITIRSCVAERFLNPACEDFFHAVGVSGTGAHLSLEVSKFSTHRASYIEIVGDGGQILGDYQTHDLWMGTSAERTRVDGVASIPTVRETLRDFVRWVRGEAANPIPLGEGVAAVAVADQCYRLCRG